MVLLALFLRIVTVYRGRIRKNAPGVVSERTAVSGNGIFVS